MMGTASTEWVWKPVWRSSCVSKRSSSYALAITMTSPDLTTSPTMPVPIGIRRPDSESFEMIARESLTSSTIMSATRSQSRPSWIARVIFPARSRELEPTSCTACAVISSADALLFSRDTSSKRAPRAKRPVRSDASTSSSITSAFSKGACSSPPLCLFSVCSTATTSSPSSDITGTQRILCVRKPVNSSVERSKRASAYASCTTSVRPVRATSPATPFPRGTVIPHASLELISRSTPASSSTRKTAARCTAISR